MVTWMRFSVTLCVHCLSCLRYFLSDIAYHVQLDLNLLQIWVYCCKSNSAVGIDVRRVRNCFSLRFVKCWRFLKTFEVHVLELNDIYTVRTSHRFVQWWRVSYEIMSYTSSSSVWSWDYIKKVLIKITFAWKFRVVLLNFIKIFWIVSEMKHSWTYGTPISPLIFWIS